MTGPPLPLSAVTLTLDFAADSCRRTDVDDVDLGEAEAALRAIDVVTYEAGDMAERIKAACGRAVNNTPVPHPVKPLPQPKEPPPPEKPKDAADDGASHDAYLKPVSFDTEGYPMYQRTEEDDERDALIERYRASERTQVPEAADWLKIDDAFCAILAPENLELAGDAVEVLGDLVDRAKDRVAWLSGEVVICDLCGDILLAGEMAAEHRALRHRDPKDATVLPFTTPGRPDPGTVDRGRIVLEMLQEVAGTILSASRASRMGPSEWSAHQLAEALKLVASMRTALDVMGGNLDDELRVRMLRVLERVQVR